MKLWLLKRVRTLPELDDPWCDEYDAARALVVRAETEPHARGLATKFGGDELRLFQGQAWLNDRYSTCVELAQEGVPCVVIRDSLAS